MSQVDSGVGSRSLSGSEARVKIYQNCRTFIADYAMCLSYLAFSGKQSQVRTSFSIFFVQYPEDIITMAKAPNQNGFKKTFYADIIVLWHCN